MSDLKIVTALRALYHTNADVREIIDLDLPEVDQTETSMGNLQYLKAIRILEGVGVGRVMRAVPKSKATNRFRFTVRNARRAALGVDKGLSWVKRGGMIMSLTVSDKHVENIRRHLQLSHVDVKIVRLFMSKLLDKAFAED